MHDHIYIYIHTACVCVCMLYECNCIVFSVCVGMYRQIDVKSHTFSHVVPHLPWALSLNFIHRYSKYQIGRANQGDKKKKHTSLVARNINIHYSPLLTLITQYYPLLPINHIVSPFEFYLTSFVHPLPKADKEAETAEGTNEVRPARATDSRYQKNNNRWI